MNARRGLVGIEGEALWLEVKPRRGPAAVTKRSAAGVDEVCRELGALLDEEHASHLRVVDVRLGGPHVEFRTLNGLPPVGARELRALIGTQSNRFFRLAREPVITDGFWLDGARERARGAAVSAEMVDCLGGVLRSAGVALASLYAVDPVTGHALRLESSQIARERRRRSLHAWISWMAASVLPWIVAAGLYVADLRSDHSRMRDEIARLEAPLTRLSSLRGELERFAPLRLVDTQHGPGMAWATLALAELTQALPVGAHLRRLELRRPGPHRLIAVVRDPPAVMRDLAQWRGTTPSLARAPVQIGVPEQPWYELEISAGAHGDSH